MSYYSPSAERSSGIISFSSTVSTICARHNPLEC